MLTNIILSGVSGAAVACGILWHMIDHETPKSVRI